MPVGLVAPLPPWAEAGGGFFRCVGKWRLQDTSGSRGLEGVCCFFLFFQIYFQYFSIHIYIYILYIIYIYYIYIYIFVEQNSSIIQLRS